MEIDRNAEFFIKVENQHPLFIDNVWLDALRFDDRFWSSMLDFIFQNRPDADLVHAPTLGDMASMYCSA